MLPVGGPLVAGAVLWAMVMGLDELVLLLLAVFSVLLAAALGAALAAGLGVGLE